MTGGPLVAFNISGVVRDEAGGRRKAVTIQRGGHEKRLMGSDCSIIFQLKDNCFTMLC